MAQGALGKWVARQRSHYREGIIASSRIEKLRKVEFTFILFMDKWMSHYEKVQRYGLREMPRELRYWLDNQRSKRRRKLLAKVRRSTSVRRDS